MENQKQNHVSLYEYLGRRAGLELGEKVYKAARKQRVKVTTKDVDQGGYKGKVMCYPTGFLVAYFNEPNAYEAY